MHGSPSSTNGWCMAVCHASGTCLDMQESMAKEGVLHTHCCVVPSLRQRDAVGKPDALREADRLAGDRVVPQQTPGRAPLPVSQRCFHAEDCWDPCHKRDNPSVLGAHSQSIVAPQITVAHHHASMTATNMPGLRC